jgi:hypothetical protein
MREPPELTRLRETLPRPHALKAFEHFHERQPDSEEELEAFIDQYVRDAYSDGVEDWFDFSRHRPVTRRSMDAPLGRKLQAAGYRSLWDYVRRNGFSDLDRLKMDLHFETLAPVGFTSYVTEVATEDGNWRHAFRILVTHYLNAASKSANPAFSVLMAISRLESEFPKGTTWVKPASQEIIALASSNKQFLTDSFAYDDEWLKKLIEKHSGSGGGT